MHPECHGDGLPAERMEPLCAGNNEVRLPVYELLCHAAQGLAALPDGADEGACRVDPPCDIAACLLIQIRRVPIQA